MAIIWQKKTANQIYQVRTAGHSIRLYSNNVFHSQWNPHTPIAGSLWDLLFLPVFFSPQVDRLNKALILGVGGGAIINLFNQYLSLDCIDGVDLDSTHIYIAKRFFGINISNTYLHRAEAQSWVSNSGRAKYDFVLEDLFLPETDSQDAVRAIESSTAWFEALLKKLSVRGVLVMNFESEKQFKHSDACRRAKDLCRLGKLGGVAFLKHPKYENCIAVFTKVAISKRTFDDNLQSYLFTGKPSVQNRLAYELKIVQRGRN